MALDAIQPTATFGTGAKACAPRVLFRITSFLARLGKRVTREGPGPGSS